MNRLLRPWIALSALLLTALPGLSQSGVQVTSVPLTPYGDAMRGSGGEAIPLTPQSFLVSPLSPDANKPTADDQVLFVNQVGGTPVITPLATPYLTSYSGRIVRFSATRAAVINAGADGVFKTDDDGFYLLDRLGSANTVTPIVTGALRNQDLSAPVPLTEDSAVVLTGGSDRAYGTGDDQLLLITDLGGSNTVTVLSAPYADTSGRSRPVRLTETSVAVSVLGPDRDDGTADDQLLLYRDLGTTNTMTAVTIPYLAGLIAGRAVPISPTRLLVGTAGPDSTDGTADDGLVLLDGLGTTNTMTSLAVPNLQLGASARPVLLSSTTAAMITTGPDRIRANADDTVAIISGLGLTNQVTQVTLGGLREDDGVTPVRLSPTSCAIVTGGPNFTIHDADDQLVIMTGVGTTNTVSRITIPGLHESPTCTPVALGVNALLISSGGPNGALETGLDDQVSLITGLPDAPALTPISAAGELRTFAPGCRASVLGGGRAVFQSSGPDGNFGSGSDDLLRIVTGLPQPRGIQVKQLSLGFQATRPTAKQTFSAKGSFVMDDPDLLSGPGLTVSIGNVAQWIPESQFRAKRNGALTYSDPKGRLGLIRSLTLDLRKRTFSLSGNGKSTGIETTAPGYVPVAFEADGFYFSDVVAGKATRKGITYRR